MFVNCELWGSEFAGLQDYASHVVLCIYSCRFSKQTGAGRVGEGKGRSMCCTETGAVFHWLTGCPLKYRVAGNESALPGFKPQSFT